MAASLAAEENEDFAFNASTSRSAVPDGVSVDGEEDEEMILVMVLFIDWMETL